MFKNIVKNSIKEMNNDTKIIRRTRITTFFHSLIVILILIINLNTLFAKNYQDGLYVGKVAQYFIQELGQNHIISITILISIVLFLAYSIIYPIGQGAIIYYLHTTPKNMRLALQKGRKAFFPMFEFSFISLITSPVVLLLLAFKLLLIDGNTSRTVLITLTIWLIGINIFNPLKAYTRYFIMLEKMPLYEAFKASFTIRKKQPKTTSKYMRVQTVLLLHFSFNLILIIGIPFGAIYFAITTNTIQYPGVRAIIYGIFACMIIFGSYISAIIRAFFVYYRYELFKVEKNIKK